MFCKYSSSRIAFSARRYLGVVPQEFNFNQFEKVYDILITQAGYFGLTHSQVKDEAEKLLKELDLWEHRNKQWQIVSLASKGYRGGHDKSAPNSQ